jgi:hypothetical protein
VEAATGSAASGRVTQPIAGSSTAGSGRAARGSCDVGNGMGARRNSSSLSEGRGWSMASGRIRAHRVPGLPVLHPHIPLLLASVPAGLLPAAALPMLLPPMQRLPRVQLRALLLLLLLLLQLERRSARCGPCEAAELRRLSSASTSASGSGSSSSSSSSSTSASTSTTACGLGAQRSRQREGGGAVRAHRLVLRLLRKLALKWLLQLRIARAHTPVPTHRSRRCRRGRHRGAGRERRDGEPSSARRARLSARQL